MATVQVYVYARDQLVERGLEHALRGQPGVALVGPAQVDAAHAAVVAFDVVDDDAMRTVRAVQRNGCPRVVLVVADIDEAGLLTAAEAGVAGIIRRRDATSEALVRAVRAATAGDGTLPPDLLGRLLGAMGRLHELVLQPRGLSLAALNEREISVLRLVADGYDTAEIAAELAYSPRTIKNIIHDVTVRLNLRNRTHAVAYALRQGLI